MRSTLAIALCLATGPALAMDIPRIDVDRVCKDYVASKPRHARGTLEQQYDECFSIIQMEYGQLKGAWAMIEPADQERCWAHASFHLVFAYGGARVCAEEALDRYKREEKAAEEEAKLRALPKREMRW